MSALRGRLEAVDARATEALAGALHGLTARVQRIARAALGIWTHSGDSLVWLALGGAAWRFGSGLWAQLGERIVLATVVAAGLTTILKFLIRRPRPVGAGPGAYFNKLDAHAFPSGHAMRAGALISAVGSLLPWWGALGLLLWAVSVALSRVILGLHHAGDVVAGLLVGAAAGAGLALLG